MGNPIRDKDPEAYRLITIRTCEGRIWLTPSGKVRKLIGGIISRYQEMCEIIIYSYFVLGNHLHLIIKAPLSNTDAFCQNMDREISRRINWKHQREGTLWESRYKDHKVLSESDLLEAFLYVNTNPTHHGLLRDASEWPGLHSFQHTLNERDRQFTFYHYSARDGEPKETKHRLKLTVLPQFENLSKIERKKTIENLFVERMNQIAEQRAQNQQGFLGLKSILTQVPGDQPLRRKKTPQPPCYTKCAELRARFRAANRARRKFYDECSFRFRLGQFDIVFPSDCYHPPLHQAPRYVPFRPLPRVFAKILK